MFNPLDDWRFRVPVAEVPEHLTNTTLHIDELQSIHPDSEYVYLYVSDADVLLISELPDGSCYLHIEREEYFGSREELEEILAKWAATEGYFDSPLISEPLTVAHAWLNSNSRSDILAILQSMDPNGSWRDSEGIAEGHDFMTLEDARAALQLMLAVK